ncbi:MAG: hypothetical protein AB1486_14355 [Planctomycetota bacterium]
MNRLKLVAALLGTSLVLAPLALSRTWVVALDGTGDFFDIQSAVDAARDGDVILVKDGTYPGFTFDKAVMVRAWGSTFTVSDHHPQVTIRLVGAGKRAGIGGMRQSGRLEILASEGEVILDDVESAAEAPAVLIENCSSVVATDLTIGGAMLKIVSSSVSCSRLSVHGASGSHDADTGNGYPGGPAIVVFNSLMVLANPVLVRGGDGGDGAFTWWYDPQGNGGAGGAAIEATDSTVIILGDEGEEVRGGDGGDGYEFYAGDGGDGGAAYLEVRNSAAVVSKVALLGGQGGAGSPPGTDGPPFIGNVTRIDRFPHLTMSGNLHPGSSFEVSVELVEAGRVLLILANRTGFVPLARFLGPPLSVLPGGGFFLVLSGGHGDAGAIVRVPVGLLDDPVLQGFPMNAQAAVIGDDGTLFLSNVEGRIVGE